MADPMRIRAKMEGDKTVVRILMSHEMETGLRKDSAGKNVPALFIQEVTATCAGKTVLSAQWGTSISKNPYLEFRFAGGKVGDKVVVSWVDSRGDNRTDEAQIAA